MSGCQIRLVRPEDHDALWDTLRPVFRAGDTYTLDPQITQTEALAYWLSPDKVTYVCDRDGSILGTYYIRPNQAGRGAHVCNCGYITAPAARGQGVARTMLEHSLQTAPRMGYRAMQYNFVVSTNTRAVTTWQRYGFEIVGTLPLAFDHPTQGYVDAYVMYKHLVTSAQNTDAIPT